jgi:hypothetical protein
VPQTPQVTEETPVRVRQAAVNHPQQRKQTMGYGTEERLQQIEDQLDQLIASDTMSLEDAQEVLEQLARSVQARLDGVSHDLAKQAVA